MAQDLARVDRAARVMSLWLHGRPPRTQPRLIEREPTYGPRLEAVLGHGVLPDAVRAAPSGRTCCSRTAGGCRSRARPMAGAPSTPCWSWLTWWRSRRIGGRGSWCSRWSGCRRGWPSSRTRAWRNSSRAAREGSARRRAPSGWPGGVSGPPLVVPGYHAAALRQLTVPSQQAVSPRGPRGSCAYSHCRCSSRAHQRHQNSTPTSEVSSRNVGKMPLMESQTLTSACMLCILSGP
jgi:hypothetical protein